MARVFTITCLCKSLHQSQDEIGDRLDKEELFQLRRDSMIRMEKSKFGCGNSSDQLRLTLIAFLFTSLQNLHSSCAMLICSHLFPAFKRLLNLFNLPLNCQIFEGKYDGFYFFYALSSNLVECSAHVSTKELNKVCLRQIQRITKVMLS